MKTLDRIAANHTATIDEPKVSLRPLFHKAPLSPTKSAALPDLINAISKAGRDSPKKLLTHRIKFGLGTFVEKVTFPIKKGKTYSQLHFDINKVVHEHTEFVAFKESDDDVSLASLIETEAGVIIDLVVKVQMSSVDTDIFLWGSLEATSALMADLEALKEPDGSFITIKTITGIERPMFFMPPSFSVSRSTHHLDEHFTLAEDGFYPFLKDQSVYDFGAEFAKSKANVVLFYGPPGNGKSTFARTMAVVMGYKNIFVCSDERIFADNLFSQLINQVEDNTIFFLEDAYQFLKKRTEGNMNMSSLLALADGVASRNIKFVISTNLTTTDEVEAALLRDGRCFGAHEFANLTFNQANVARAAIDLPPLPRSMGNREMSLATALNSKAIDAVESAEQSNVIDLPVTQSAK